MTAPVLCVIGTRPEAIKMAPVVRELARRGVPHHVVSTGQHRELVRETLDVFGIEVHSDLDLMTDAQTPTDVAARVIAGLGLVIADIAPASVVVQGDTTTVMAAAIAGAYAQVPVAHLEAGLRTGDRRHPFPEEINRRIVGAAADLHFAPTVGARENLLGEGIDPASVVLTGNTVIDALHWATDLLDLAPPSPVLEAVDSRRRLVLLTAHRRESFGEPMLRIFETVRQLVHDRDDVHVVYPVHPNPNVHGPAHDLLGGLDQVTLCDPLGYLDLIGVMDAAHLVLTDSGGLQEEAPALGKPVLVLRETTERPEAIHYGVADLVGTDPLRIRAAVDDLLDHAHRYTAMARGASPYGDGQASARVVAALQGEQVDEFDPATLLTPRAIA